MTTTTTKISSIETPNVTHTRKQRRNSVLLTVITILLLLGNAPAVDARSQHHKSISSALPRTNARGGATIKKQTKDKVQLPTVQAILVPRSINLLRVVQGLSLGFLLLSLVRCILTAGIPFTESVWTSLHSSDIPSNYEPSKFDLLLTQYSTLPPPFLPTAGPLVSLLISSMAFVGLGLLLPQWCASSYRVALEYKQLASSSNDGMARNLMQEKLKKKKLAVLVQVPRETRMHTEQNKALVVCPLQQTATKAKSKGRLFFDLCNQRYYYDDEGKKKSTVTSGAPTLVDDTITSLLANKGLTTASKLTAATSQFDAYNHISLPTPTIFQAFGARLASPLVVLQLFGKILSALEDSSLLHTAFSMSQTLTHHYWNARQSIVSARELAQEVHDEANSVVQVRVKRATSKKKKKQWTTVNAMKILPGDVFQLGGKGKGLKQQHLAVPVDAVIIEGSAVTNEAVLTGETVAQSKVALEQEEDKEETLDMMGRHRSSVLFAGTTILHSPEPLTCLALRTGSYSSRGDLLRALQKSRVGAISNPQTEKDGLRLMACLGVVACGSCAYFWNSEHSDNVSVFRKVLQCSRILLAAIPSDLPLGLSAIAQSCAMQLKQHADVVCSEPGSLLTAATVTHVLFDKTGTLTADTQSLSHNVIQNGTPEEGAGVELVLAGCHSLVEMQKGEELVGDPLDLASLRYTTWSRQPRDGSYKKGDGSSTLWQIKTFPFDANRKTSSSLVLVQDEDKSFRLIKLLKGSPDVVQDMVVVVDDNSFFDNAVTELGEEGYRVIAMGIQDVTNDTELVGTLFPSGLPTAANSTNELTSATKMAKKKAQSSLQRDAVEAPGFDFGGFSCFEAVVRPSTPRIIKELQQAQVGVTMLTGDGVDAAVSVARRCELISNSTTEVAVLDWEDSKLCWKRLGGEGKNQKPLSTRQVFGVNAESYALVATGNAVEALADKDFLTNDEKLVQSKLHTFAVFARASPSQKVFVASTFKQNDRKVLMCGDGVNDVAAMKVADCGVALLNGFGDQSTGEDLEDDRRRQGVLEKRIGSNRRIRHVKVGNPSLSRSGRANRAKVKAKIDKALFDIKKEAADRQGIKDPMDPALRLTVVEMRASFAAISKINKAEREKAKLLKKGGAGAAKILAENDKELNGGEARVDDQDIKPGEASLVSPFSCLRPAIDGVEAILRYSVAASSFMQVMHQAVALNCLTSAFNLATLYKNGFRYGKNMWNVELPLYLLTEQASNQAACTPRPRLAKSRPPISFFHPFSVMAVLVQFFIHAMTRTTGVRIANRLDAAFIEPDEFRRLVEVAEHPSGFQIDQKPMIQLLMESLVQAPVEKKEESKVPAVIKLFQRAPFKPNYLTNVIFLQSIFQSAISTLVNHKGRPFHGAVLEHRQLIVSIALSILFPISSLAEGFPKVNALLELRPLPNTSAQICLLAVFFIDLVGCLIAGMICKVGSGVSMERPEVDYDGNFDESKIVSAADQEEKLLFEEADDNGSLVRIMVAATGMIFMSSLSKTLEAQQSK